MKELFPQVVLISLAVSAVALPLLIFGGRIRHRYAARTLYFLWLLLAVRLAVPLPMALPNAPVQVGVPDYVVYTDHGIAPTLPAAEETSVILKAGEHAVTEMETVTEQVVVTDTVTAAYYARQLSLWSVLGWVWAAGAAAFLLWQCAAYLLARRGILRHAVAAGDDAEALLERLRDELGIRACVTLCRSYRVASPMMLGLFRPVIVLHGQAYDPDALEAVLRHELCHLRRGDLAYKGLLLLANAVHWFNPVVWLLVREAGRNVELCCDDEVLRYADGPTRKHYGEVLLNTAAPGSAPVFSTRFGGGKRQLRDRLLNLAQRKPNSAVLVLSAAALVLLCGALVACESGGAAAVEASFTVSAPSAPTAPEPPEPPALTAVAALGETLYANFSGFRVHPLGNGETDYDTAEFAEVTYDPESGLLGGEKGLRTLAMADDVLLRYSAEDIIGSAAGERGTAERGRALLNFLYWPLLRSYFSYDTDLLAITLDGMGEVVEMTWLSLPETADARAVRTLADSVVYEEGAFLFTIPADDLPESEWSIHIAGRIPAGDDGFMSAHYLEETEWEPGKTYRITDGFINSAADPADGASLNMTIACGSAERELDLLALAEPTAVVGAR